MKTNRILSRVGAIVFIFTGIIDINNSKILYPDYKLEMIMVIGGTLLVIGGILFFVLSTLSLSEKSRFAPSIRVDEKEIRLKRNLFISPVIISWNDIKNIQMGSYDLAISTNRGKIDFLYRAYPDDSALIKSFIRELAELKQIAITG